MNIKEKIQSRGIYQWQIAEKLKISEFTFSRWMRRPERLSKERIDGIENAINELTLEKQKGV